MTKSSVLDFVGLYTAILKDIAVYFPDDQRDWDRDLQRIISLSQTRGPSFSTMDLPALGKRLDLALSSGCLDVFGLPQSAARFPHSKIPRLFWGLWSRLFDDSGCLKADVDPNVVLFLRTLLYVGKNYEAECAPRYLFEATSEFFNVEEELPPPSDIWNGDGSDMPDSSHVHLRDMVANSGDQPLLFFGAERTDTSVLDSVQRVADRVSCVFDEFNPSGLRFKHGPGAVSDLKRGEYKYIFPNWAPRLEYYFPYDECGSTSLEVGGIDPTKGYEWDSEEPHSVLIAVPKTMKGPRLIAKEPTSHQWIQQGMRDYVYRKVSSSWLGNSIDFHDQGPSRREALLASLDGRKATIDLKSASDRISCALVERIFRRNPKMLGAMVACRTRFIRNPIDKKCPELHKLRKFSTQGSALTFPIQSIVFLCVCVGVGKHLNPRMGIEELGRQVRIFGDDLIVPVEWEPLVREVLHSLHLRVNLTKTHARGYFRESCGMDAFRGYDVTPAYVLSAPVESDARSIASWLAVTNNLFLKGFWRTSQWLESTLPRKILNRIPVVKLSNGSFARKSFSGSYVSPHLKRRWNDRLQRGEVLCLQVFAKAQTIREDAAAALLQFFTEDPLPYIKYESGVTVAGVPAMRNAWVEEDLLAV